MATVAVPVPSSRDRNGSTMRQNTALARQPVPPSQRREPAVTESIAVLGGGPAGLTAGYALARRGRHAVVLERDDIVGGLARTVERDGYRFDLGGHRFFTKSARGRACSGRRCSATSCCCGRGSRGSTTAGSFIEYPLRPKDVVAQARASGARARARLLRSRPAAPPGSRPRPSRTGSRAASAAASTSSSSGPTPRRSGASLHRDLRAEWAAQRISDLSLASALRAASSAAAAATLKTLIEEFRYPRLGRGRCGRRCAAGSRPAAARSARARARSGSTTRAVALTAARRRRRAGRARPTVISSTAAARRWCGVARAGAAGAVSPRPRTACATATSSPSR